MTEHDFLLAFYSFCTAFIGWPVAYLLYRLAHPWRCKCGRLHWSTRKMFTHIELKHVVDDGGK